MSTTDDKQPSITIFRGWKDFGRHVWSPFVIKLEARLRFAGVKYRVDVGSPKTAPKGKIPYVECSSLPVAAAGAGPEGKVQLSDSTLIIKALSEWDVTPDINAALSPAGRAKDMALRALLEDKLYFYHTWERWVLNYYTMRNHVFQALPYPVRILVGMLVYRSTVATLHGQGTGRYSAEEIAGFRQEIWESVNDLLVESRTKSTSDSAGSQEPFWVFGGEKPTEADATLFGFIVSVLVSTAGPDSQKVVRSFPVVLDYARRIQDKYFPDYESWSP
ncbi:putative Glutathione S-transferase [Seiridium cardinale]|uniref:Glutathione S-transferase n=1 Tax=Seiridium cardinale TaxID=138064 RepID=A0ABR2Y2R4_9PEZI